MAIPYHGAHIDPYFTLPHSIPETPKEYSPKELAINALSEIVQNQCIDVKDRISACSVLAAIS
jgi:hypothetical protein